MLIRALSLAAGVMAGSPACAAALTDCSTAQMREFTQTLERAERDLSGVRQDLEAAEARVMAAIDGYEERRIEAEEIDRILIEAEADQARLRAEQSAAELQVARLLEKKAACQHTQRLRPAPAGQPGPSGG